MAQIDNIKSKIQQKEEFLTKKESELDMKMIQIRKKEEELLKKENELKSKEEQLEREQNDFNPIPPQIKNNDDDNNNHALPTIKTLIYGIEIPYLGLGTSRISDPINIVYNSIKNGLRLIDAAFKYGNEKEVGEGIKKAIDEGLCKREDLFIIGKIWLFEREDPEKAIKSALNRLQLKYLDLYLDHRPSGNIYDRMNNCVEYRQQSIFDVWPKMESLVEKGLTRGIGCSNYNVQSLLNLLSFCKIKPVVNEIELHPYYFSENLIKFCNKENIAIIAYYPLAHGNGAKKYIKEHGGQMNSFQEKNILDLAQNYNRTPTQIILNWEISQGIITIPGISQEKDTEEEIIKKRIKENLGALDFKMSNEDIKLLNSNGKKQKFCGCKRFFGINIMA